MSDGHLPEKIDPLRIAEARRELKGVLPVAAMPRLVSLLADASGEVEVEIVGSIEGEGVRALRGRLRAVVNITCQRCLEGFQLPIEAELKLGVVSDESLAERLPEEYEPLVAGDEPVLLREIVEDELILALPLVPRHADMDCAGAGTGAGDEPEKGGRENPFATLLQLKNSRKS